MKQTFVKLITMILTLSLLLVVSCSSANKTNKITFSDVTKEYWGYETIMKMTEAGIFRGATEPVNGVGTFLPKKVMTRAEFITASLRSIFPEETKSIKNDSQKWWKGYYSFALDKGILFKWELNNGDLDKPMTREEMAMIMVRCVEENGEKMTSRIKSSRIPDYNKIGVYYKDYVLDCFSFGLLCGVDDEGTFAPDNSLIRAEAATVICRLLDKEMRVEINSGGSSAGNKDDNSNPGGNQTDKNDQDNPGSDNSGSGTPSPDQNTPVVFPWENGGKQPSDYSWEEYRDLSAELKEAFYDTFGSAEAFDLWMDRVMKEWQDQFEPDNGEDGNQGGTDPSDSYPWENSGKKPSDYTWKEFTQLDETVQEAFVEWFETSEAFEAWMNEAKKKDTEESEKYPWEEGGKRPDKYTWKEFTQLDETVQEAFAEWFATPEAFEDWMNKAKKADDQESEKYPWEEGGKSPDQYTWKEFMQLADTVQEAFAEWFATPEAFEAWMNEAKKSDTEDSEKYPWEEGGKRPDKYTWEEFMQLDDIAQEAFFAWFDSVEAFEEWMNGAN